MNDSRRLRIILSLTFFVIVLLLMTRVKVYRRKVINLIYLIVLQYIYIYKIHSTKTEILATKTSETSAAKTDPSSIESPDLLWTFVYENEDFAPNSLAMHPDGELVVVGAYCATYTHRLYDSELTDTVRFWQLLITKVRSGSGQCRTRNLLNYLMVIIIIYGV